MSRCVSRVRAVFEVRVLEALVADLSAADPDSDLLDKALEALEAAQSELFGECNACCKCF